MQNNQTPLAQPKLNETREKRAWSLAAIRGYAKLDFSDEKREATLVAEEQKRKGENTGYQTARRHARKKNFINNDTTKDYVRGYNIG